LEVLQDKGFAVIGLSVLGLAVLGLAVVGFAVIGFAVVGFAVVGLAVVGLAVVGFVVHCVVVGLLVWLAVHSVGRDVWFAFKQILSPLQQLTKLDVIGSQDPALSHAWSPLQEFKILPILPTCPAFSHADMPLQAFSIFPAAPSQ
jgi:hypothetical protein